MPVPSSTLTPLVEANRWLVAMAVDHAALRKATLDVNATIVPSGRREALFTYRAANGTHQGEKDCHTLNCFLAERGTMLCTEKPDGNLPAREGNVRVLLAISGAVAGSDQEVRIWKRLSGAFGANHPALQPAGAATGGVAALRGDRLREFSGALAGADCGGGEGPGSGVEAIAGPEEPVAPREAASRRMWKWTRKTRPSRK